MYALKYQDARAIVALINARKELIAAARALRNIAMASCECVNLADGFCDGCHACYAADVLTGEPDND
jgi:hypothetical protein